MGKISRSPHGTTKDFEIVIPVYGAYDKLELNLAALQAQGLSDRVILVDDAYKSPLPAFAKSVKSVRNKVNLGFPGTCNRGAQEVRAPVIVFMNSDVVMLEGWHDAMMRVFGGDLDQQIAVQGAKLIFPLDSNDPTRPAGKIQHAGVVFPPNKVPVHAFIGWSPDNPRVNRLIQVQAVTGAFLAIRRSVFNLLKGFNQVFGRGTYEDMDLCIRVNNLGKAVLYNPLIQGYHHVGASGERFPLGDNHHKFMSLNANSIIWDEAAVL